MTPIPPTDSSTWIVAGVCCATEEAVLRKCLDGWLGEAGYAFNAVTGELEIPAELHEQALRTKLQQAGFEAKKKGKSADTVPALQKHRGALVPGAAALLIVAALVLERMAAAGWVTRSMLGAAIILGGWRIVRKAYKAIRLGVLDMNVLMTVAVCGAVAIGKWDEGAAVIILFSLALLLESYSTDKTRRSIRSLMSVSPEEASIVDGSSERVIPARVVEIGARIVIRPGERIPLDGIVLEGRSDVDESPITGESSPSPKLAGDETFAGSINQRGMLIIRVTRRYDDTTLSRIVRSIESSEKSRAPAQDFVDRFASVYTPVVFAGALLVSTIPPLFFHGSFGEWSYRALVMMVIACPCALVISTPVTIVSALTGAARNGILVKGGKYLQAMSAIQAIAFDKTGTITEGRPQVTDIITLDAVSRVDAMKIVAALERYSDHHLADALGEDSDLFARESESLQVENFEALPGRGVRGRIDGTTYFLGNETLCREEEFLSGRVQGLLSRLGSEGKTTMVLGKRGTPLCVLAARDAARHASKETIAKLRGLGVKHLVMVSGDHSAVVDSIAREVGLLDNGSAMLPQEKVERIRQLQDTYGTVAMVGDGINDGPALEAAEVGVAMGVRGSDTALETADVVLMSDELAKLPLLIGLSRKAMQIVRQNIAIALTLKAVFLVLSIAGMTTLWMALLADDGAALIVIVNGFRALTPGKIS